MAVGSICDLRGCESVSTTSAYGRGWYNGLLCVARFEAAGFVSHELAHPPIAIAGVAGYTVVRATFSFLGGVFAWLGNAAPSEASENELALEGLLGLLLGESGRLGDATGEGIRGAVLASRGETVLASFFFSMDFRHLVISLKDGRSLGS